MTVSAAILCPEVCISDILNKAGVCVAKASNISWISLFRYSLVKHMTTWEVKLKKLKVSNLVFYAQSTSVVISGWCDPPPQKKNNNNQQHKTPYFLCINYNIDRTTNWNR